jgi:hypothetical protein
MGTQDKHDLLLRITHPGEEGKLQDVSLGLAWQLRATQQQEIKNRSRRQLGVSARSSPRQVTMSGILGRHLSVYLSSRQGTQGWLACRPSQGNRRAVTCKKPRGARGARRRWMDMACLATTPLLVHLMHLPRLHGSSI